MILNLTNKNNGLVCKALAMGLKYSHYNEECFSTGDIRRHIDLTDDVSAIICKIAFYGVDIREELEIEFNKEGVEFNKNTLDTIFDSIENKMDEYDIKINSHSIWRVVKGDNELIGLFTEGNVPPVETEFYTVYDSIDMFVPIIKLNLNKEGSIEYLLKEDNVFNEAYNILDKELENYIIKEVICIKEPNSSKEIGSEIRIKYSNYKEIIYAIVNEKGTESDILLVRDNLIYKVIPLEENIFGNKSARQALAKDDVVKYQSVINKYNKADAIFTNIKNRLINNLNLSAGEDYAYSYVDNYNYGLYKEIYSENVMEIDVDENMKYVDYTTDVSFLSEIEYNNLKSRKQDMDKILSIIEDVLVDEDLRKSYKVARKKLSLNIVQFNTETSDELCKPKYTDVCKLITRFDDLVKII